MKIRSSNFELLRIISMLFIVSYHYGRHGIYTFENNDLSINKFFASFLEIGGQFGVSIFILITGYFLSNKNFRSFRLIKLLVDTWYYSLLGIAFSILVVGFISRAEFIKSLFPMIFERYWFVTTYMLLLLVAPYINILLNNITKKQFQGALVILIFIFSIVRTIFMVEINYSNIIWFGVLYLSGSYIKKYQDDFVQTWQYYLKYSILIYLIIALIIFMFDLLAVNDDIYNLYSSYYVKITSFPLFLSSIMLFLATMKYPNFHSKKINLCASNIFAVYLIHDNDLFRNYMWRNMLHTPEYEHTTYFFAHFICTMLVIFVAGMTFDYLSRKLFLNKVEDNLERYCKKLDIKIKEYV